MSPFAFCARSFSLSHPLTLSLNGHFITTTSLSTTKAVKTKKKSEKTKYNGVPQTKAAEDTQTHTEIMIITAKIMKAEH